MCRRGEERDSLAGIRRREPEAARDRLKQLREHKRASQADFAKLLGISQQAYGKKERGESDGFSPGDFEKILKDTQIDARWLFGQLEVPIEQADFSMTSPQGDAAEVHQIVAEFKTWKESISKDDKLLDRIQSDPELRQCVELLIENRGEVKRVIGYIDRGREDRTKPGQREARLG
jgi:transcriptional regulator with XRE-family HTH domain